jgi:hypothetical protein
MQTDKKNLESESETESLTMHRSGMMCELSMRENLNLIESWLDALPSSLLEARLVSQVQLPEAGSAKQMTVGYGGIRFASVESSDRGEYFLRTPQASLLSGTEMETCLSERYSGSWPKSVMMRGRSLFRLRKSVRSTNGNEFGSLPIQTVSHRNNKSASNNAKFRPSLFNLVNIPTPKVDEGGWQRSNENSQIRPLLRMLVNLPTPRHAERSGYQNDSGNKDKPRLSLLGTIKKIKLPTPIASENENRQLSFTPNQMNGTNGKSLVAVVGNERLPTPTQRDKSSRGRSEANIKSPALNHIVTNGKGSGLNPEFEEIQMGWPLGWTADEFDVSEFEYWRQNFWNWFLLNPLLDQIGKWAAWRVHEDRFDCITDGLVKSYKGIQKRRDAIGLGIVPQCMVMAWKILNEEI